MSSIAIKLILMLAALMPFSAISADRLTITRLTDNSVTVGGRKLKAGDSFDEGAAIQWSTPSQQMEAKNTRTGSIYRFSARQFATKKGVNSVKDFFLRVNKASTRKAEGADMAFTPSPQASQFPEKRIALLIGNSNYTNISSLRNPMYDAEALAESLGKLGFDIYEAYDCDYTDMISALNAFAGKAKGYDVAMFYYSGHGLQENGRNYLIPVTANLEFKSELTRCIDAYDVLERIENTGAENRIVCLDACRDVKTSWTRSAAEGLTTMEGNPGTAIICSTRSGQVALDGETDNSPFTTAFVNALADRGRGFADMMSRVVKSTYDITERRQCPIVNGTLLSDFIFNPIGTTIRTLTSVASNAVASSSLGASSVSSSAPAATTAVAPSRPAAPQIGVECDVPGLTIKVSPGKRSGKNVLIDVVFINNTSDAMKAGFVGKEPCAGYDDYVTSAWDINGDVYGLEQGDIWVLKGNDRLYEPLTLPLGVPVKVRLVVRGVAGGVTLFPLLSMAFRDLMPYESYGQALVRVRNLPIQ
ncbi:MAG: caspase family protein [Duncaniella sp.]|nr:caspase family protein [Duncaniella sp.]